jgi:tetratricopeptide (TPR) repeat protein
LLAATIKKTTDLRLYEKILIGIVLLLFGLQLLPDFTGKGAFFGLATWLLALSYLIGGYWLLNPKDNRKHFIPIIAGLAFATSLSVLPFTIRIRKETVFEILPLLNVGLFLGLGIYLLIKRNAKDIVKYHKSIFIRSAIILTVVGFFSYTPASFKPYRYILIGLNNGNDYLIGNMQMFNYTEEFEDALERGDCERAIDNAKKANEAGKAWLGISTVEEDNSKEVEDAIKKLESDSTKLPSELNNLLNNFSNQSQLWKISGTFSNLYKAYKCKADEYYENSDYEQALNFYSKADKALNACDHNSEYWDVEQAYSLNLIALCYKKLYNYEYADSLFAEAIEKYQAVKDTTDRNVAIFYSNLAESMAEQLQFGYSNLIYKASIVILQRDSTNEENKKDIIENYHSLIKNHLQADSLEQAMFFIAETFKRVNKATVDFCNTNLYHGLCFYKLSEYKRADEILTECLDCYKNLLEPANQNIAENHLALAQAKIALAEYDLAASNLDKGLEITTKNYGESSARYANYLKVYAHLDKELGNYEKSEQEYYRVLETYINEFGERNRKLPEVLSGLADLEIVLAKFDKAKAHSDSSMSIANYFIDLDNPATTGLINNAAYVNYNFGLYEVADSYYKKTININNEYDLQLTAPTAIALNGLGLVMTAKRKYQTADSLFVQTLKLHKEIFTENHPFTAIVHLNYANLKIEENKLKQAKEMLNKSLNINKKFFDKGHDIFADINVAYGDIAKKEKQNDLAKDYYQKALDIYLVKFDEGHLRVKSTIEKIKGSS